MSWRPHGYEIFVVVNLAVIYALTRSHSDAVISTVPRTFETVGFSLLIQAIAGVLVRFVIGLIARTWRGYLAIIRRPQWIVESFRMLIFSTLMVHIYCWVKLTVPLLHPRLFDQELWDLDRSLCFGVSPNTLALYLFSNHRVLRAIDMTYGNLFFWSLGIAFAYFMSSPSARLRIAFVSSHTAMWLVGGWMYLAVPSLGPAYRFPDVWFPFADRLKRTIELQSILWNNYRKVLMLRGAGPRPAGINVLYGIGAFPSLHVGFQTFAFLWFRRIWTWGEVIFAIFVLIIFLGALVTGWHYLVDLFAGIALAWGSWAVASRRYKIIRWSNLRRIL